LQLTDQYNAVVSALDMPVMAAALRNRLHTRQAGY
jgi:hypothetical protein